MRWYGLTYGLGLMLSVLYSRSCIRKQYFSALYPEHIEDFVNVAVMGVVFGARLGHFILYDTMTLVQDPVRLFFMWEGGLSFHGGLIGLCLALKLYARKKRIKALLLADALVCGAPIGLFWGRIGNFMNQELCGHPTDRSWGIVFPNMDGQRRHPSQLYEACLEGIILFVILRILMLRYARKWPSGRISAFFLIFYGFFRCVGEIFRVPDDGLYKGITWGQWYSFPMIVMGALLLIRSLKTQSSQSHLL